MKPLAASFFDRCTQAVAKDLLGKILRIRHNQGWLAARIIETEAYEMSDKGSHAALGYTEKRKALFMPPGTVYMYYARGGDSLNFSTKGEGNAVLIKSAFPYQDDITSPNMIKIMQQQNKIKNSNKIRAPEKLCAGQTLLCQALGLKVPQWDQQQCDPDKFFIEDVGIIPKKVIQTTRLGIPEHRDPHLMYRFIDYEFAKHCTQNPLSKRGWRQGEQYQLT